MSLAAVPTRKLTAEELDAYERDGVVMVKGLLDKNWLNMIEHGVEQALNKSSIFGRITSRKTPGYNMDIYLWKRIDVLRDLVYYSPFAHWAQQLMDSKEVRFFYDQMFVKEPGVDAPTPWHQDLAFWPMKGNQICSFWIPLDPVNRESSGLQYVKGSHKWPQRFRPDSPDHAAIGLGVDLELAPDIHAHPDKYDVVDWEMEPGDVLMFHPLTLHGSSGNKTRKQKRRALALRWVGDDVTHSPDSSPIPIPYKYKNVDGSQFAGPLFPRILPNHIETERMERSKGIESQINAGFVKSGIKNLVTATKLKLSGFDEKSVKQTW